LEAGGIVDTGRFSNIFGQIAYGDIQERFADPALIASSLVNTRPAITQRGEVVPGMTNIGDQASNVGEGEEYPSVGFGESWISTPSKVKDGFMLAVTEETFREDQTGLLQEVLNSALGQQAIGYEKDGLNVNRGIDNTYSRNGGPTQNTYNDTHTEGDFDNLETNPFTDFEDIEDAMRLFERIDDLDTGEPVPMPTVMTIVCPQALKTNMLNHLNPGVQVKLGSDASAVQAIAPNPLTTARSEAFNIVSNQYVRKQQSDDDAIWFMGDFTAAFEYAEYFPPESHVLEGNHPYRVEKDIITKIRVRRKGAFGVRRPWMVVKNA
jgi:hypothetical protein